MDRSEKKPREMENPKSLVITACTCAFLPSIKAAPQPKKNDIQKTITSLRIIATKIFRLLFC